ncbi:taurine ABC transporter substrate-binding protein [Corynebacterium vitaeruminis]|uniref:taurine ABC transporter substrate-binding protein n=1 Tax=Corynebacterium vitaeruminis TaxID=38305 RepID=UPI0009DCFE27|nr:ABC transporter substrate-binding protein [Corynebacterium vitaeruminis]
MSAVKETRILKLGTAASIAVAGVSLTACVGPPANQLAEKWGMIEATTTECPVAVDESVTGDVTLGWQAIPNGDLIVYQQGLLESCMPNAHITWQRFDGGGDVIQSFGAGDIDLATLGSAGVAKALSKPLSFDARVTWALDVIGTSESLVARDPQDTTLQSLRGKKIAVPSASTSHYSLLQALKQAGMSDTDVQLVFMAPDKILAGWQSGDIDAAWIWDPTLSQLKESGVVVTSSAETAKAGAPTYDLSMARSDFVSDNPGFMNKWVELENYAAKMISDSPDEAAPIIAEALGTDADQVKIQLEGYQYPQAAEQDSENLLGGKLGEQLYDAAGFLKSVGQIDAVSDKDIYLNAPVTDYS